jgi:hypothetical protein
MLQGRTDAHRQHDDLRQCGLLPEPGSVEQSDPCDHAGTRAPLAVVARVSSRTCLAKVAQRPQVEATPSSSRSLRIEHAPSLTASRIWRSVTPWQTHTYMWRTSSLAGSTLRMRMIVNRASRRIVHHRRSRSYPSDLVDCLKNINGISSGQSGQGMPYMILTTAIRDTPSTQQGARTTSQVHDGFAVGAGARSAPSGSCPPVQTSFGPGRARHIDRSSGLVLRYARRPVAGQVSQRVPVGGSVMHRPSSSSRQLADRRHATTRTPSDCACARKLFITLCPRKSVKRMSSCTLPGSAGRRR